MVSIVACLFLIICFCNCVGYALDFTCSVRHLPAANRMAHVWHAFETVPGVVE